MAEMKQIHDLAVKWYDKFRDQNINYIELVDHWMSDDCAALGFEMDCGHTFSERYGQAAFILNGDILITGHTRLMDGLKSVGIDL